MTRILLVAGAILAATSFKPAQAAEAPWCAFIAVAQGAVYEDCQYRTFEACRAVVLSGNRGFCNQNQRYTGPVSTKRSKRRVNQD